ncbi:MAG: Rab family GTPase [Candidatus Heimdallarchaeota archaeon]
MVSFFDTYIGPRLLMSLPATWHKSTVEEKVASLLDTITLGFFSYVIDSYKVINYHFEIPSEWARGKRELVMISVVFSQTYKIPEDRVKKALTSVAEEIQGKKEFYKAFYIFDSTKPEKPVRKAQQELTQIIAPLFNEMEVLIHESPKMNKVEREYVNLKIVVVGDPAVGKTSLTTRYATGEFRETYLTTIGVNFFRKDVQINDREVRVQFWDTGGQERFNILLPAYYKAAQAAILVYDLTSRESFEKITFWMNQVLKHCPDARFCLVGNKNDLENQRSLSTAEGVKLSKKLGCKFFETSAKTDTNVTEMFETIIGDIMSG